MAKTLVQNKKAEFTASSASLTVTFAAGTTAGNVIVVAGMFDRATTGVTISDGSGDTVTIESAVFDDTATSSKSFIAAFYNVTAGTTTVTATYSGTNPTFGDMYIWEVGGITSGQKDKLVRATGTGTAADSGSTGTLSTADEFAIGYGISVAAFSAAGSGWSTNADDGITANTGSLGEHRITAATTAINGTGTNSNNQWVMYCATFMSGGVVTLPTGGDVTERRGTDRRRLFPINLRTWTWSYNLNLVGQDRFPPGKNVYDLAPKRFLPERPPTWTEKYNPNLVGKDVFPPGRKGAFSDLSPIAYPPPGKIWTWQYNLNLVGKDRFPPGKIYTERPQPVSWYRDWSQSLLLSTLRITQAAPFNQFDWPLPSRALQPDRTWTSFFNPNLVGQDQFPPGQVSNRILTQPPWYRDWSQNLLQSTLTPAAALPFNQYNWPIPRSYEYPVDLRTWINGAIQIIAEQAPLNQFDWPISQRVPASGQTWTQNLLLTTLSTPQAIPFNQDDWPLPQRAAQPDRTWVSYFNPNLIAQDVLPIRQMDWVVPGRLYIVGQTWTQNLLLTTLAVAQAIPFNQFDWPLPQRTQWPTQTWTTFFNPNLLSQDALPVRQMDWPNPSGYIYPSHLRNAGPLNLNLFPPPTPPVVTGQLRNPQFIGTTVGQMGTWGVT